MRESRRVLKRIGSVVVFLLMSAAVGYAQTDPGVRTGPANAGGPFPGLSVEEQKLFLGVMATI